jgi:hypothetical protein
MIDKPSMDKYRAAITARETANTEHEKANYAVLHCPSGAGHEKQIATAKAKRNIAEDALKAAQKNEEIAWKEAIKADKAINRSSTKES